MIACSLDIRERVSALAVAAALLRRIKRNGTLGGHAPASAFFLNTAIQNRASWCAPPYGASALWPTHSTSRGSISPAEREHLMVA